MFGNLTRTHLLFIIICIIIFIWLINWLINRKKNKQHTIQTDKSKENNQLDFSSDNAIDYTNTKNLTNPVIQQENTPFVLYYFYHPTCPYCINFHSTWNELYSRISNVSGLTTIAIDSSRPENENLSFYYNVSSFPTIILVTPDKNIEYPGNLPRTVENISTFVMSNINNYQ